MTKETIEIPSDVAEELSDCHEGETLHGFRYVTDQDEGSGRWEAHHLMVVEHLGTGNFYGIAYSLGLTENQDSSLPWRPDWRTRPETVTAYRVWPERVTTTVYRDSDPDD